MLIVVEEDAEPHGFFWHNYYWILMKVFLESKRFVLIVKCPSCHISHLFYVQIMDQSLIPLLAEIVGTVALAEFICKCFFWLQSSEVNSRRG